MIQKCLMQQEMTQMVVFGDSGGSTAVSSQLLNKHRKSNYHTKAHCCNSFFGLVPALALTVLNDGTSAPSKSIRIESMI